MGWHGEHQTGILTTKTILMVKISSEKIVLYDMTTFYCTLTVANRDRNTVNLLLASAIVAIFTEMNSLDQEKFRSA